MVGEILKEAPPINSTGFELSDIDCAAGAEDCNVVAMEVAVSAGGVTVEGALLGAVEGAELSVCKGKYGNGAVVRSKALATLWRGNMGTGSAALSNGLATLCVGKFALCVG